MLGDKEIEYKIHFWCKEVVWKVKLCTLENVALKLFYRLSKKFKEH